MTGPGRGRWDRSLSRDRRRELAHRRLLEVATSALPGGPVTTTQVVAEAGVSRNTFYRHFPNAEALVQAAVGSAVDDMRRAVGRSVIGARTPLERVRALASAWLTQALDRRALVPAILSGHGAAGRRGAELLRDLERHLRDALHLAKAAGIVGLAPDALRLRCLVAAYVAAALHAAEQPGSDVRPTSDLLVDLTVRSFR